LEVKNPKSFWCRHFRASAISKLLLKVVKVVTHPLTFEIEDARITMDEMRHELDFDFDWQPASAMRDCPILPPIQQRQRSWEFLTVHSDDD
jgi:hypothetical protein